MSASRNATILLEEGILVLAFTLSQNDHDIYRRFRCIRGLAGNAVREARRRDERAMRAL